jgi:hypothetical protein
MLDQFEKPGDIDITFAKNAANAPAVRQVEAKLEIAQRDLAQAELVTAISERRSMASSRDATSIPETMFRSVRT